MTHTSATHTSAERTPMTRTSTTQASQLTPKLGLDPAIVGEARRLAELAGRPIVELARTHTTVSVERAVLRLAGLDGADGDGMPWVNRLTDAVREQTGLSHGVALPAWDALRSGGYPDLRALAVAAAEGTARFRIPDSAAAAAARQAAASAVGAGLGQIDARRAERTRMIRETAEPPMPWIYLIVATGNIYDDVDAGAGRRAGRADIIAVIRSTGAVAARLRAAGRDHRGLRRHLRHAGELPASCARRSTTSRRSSAATSSSRTTPPACACPRSLRCAGWSGSTCCSTTAMYGILFRDINMRRTFIDQHFSRRIHAPWRASSSTPARTTTSPPPTP